LLLSAACLWLLLLLKTELFQAATMTAGDVLG
jgi:hypothetical protein